MPFRNNAQLPTSVRNVLPPHGQDIYRESFNSAWDQYDEPQERREGRDREETAHAVAWSAVKKVYHKNQAGEWVRQSTKKA